MSETKLNTEETTVDTTEEVVEEVEVSEEVANSIAGAVVKGLLPQLEKSLDEKVEKKLSSIENVVSKAGGFAVAVPTEYDKKEVEFVRALKNLKKNRFDKVRDYNNSQAEARAKAGYANSGTDADGGYVIPPADFEAEVERLEPLYGIALQEASVVQVQGNSVKTNKLGSNVTMYETSEGGAKTGTKLTLEQDEVQLRKFAAIAPLTDELNDDSAVDFYNELVIGFAQERARIADLVTMTENGTVYKGILRTAGINVESIASVAAITWDDLLNAESFIPTVAESNAKWYMHKTLWNLIKQIKDSNDRYQALPFAGMQTPWGSDVVLADIMPRSTDADSDGSTPLAFYGDMKRTKLYVKRGLVIDILREGTVADADGGTINLAQQDMTAVRAVTRMVSLVKFPSAYSAIGTGTVS